MNNQKTNVYVGIFVVFGIVGALFLSIKLGNINLFGSDTYPLVAEFKSVSGLKKDANVEISGVKVGYVSDITYLNNGKAQVALRLNKGIAVDADSVLSIRTKGLIGDKFLKLSPGGSTEEIKSGGKIIETESSIDIEDLLGKFIHKFE